MTRQQQSYLPLISLFLVGVGLAVLLSLWHPTVSGASLRDAELTRPLAGLLPAEQSRFFKWLGVDYAFALVYTVFYTSALRFLAAIARGTWLDLGGRVLSWITAIAILFDLTENAILWAAASTAATQISPWLPVLVKLKWVSTVLFLGYLCVWIVHRFVYRTRLR